MIANDKAVAAIRALQSQGLKLEHGQVFIEKGYCWWHLFLEELPYMKEMNVLLLRDFIREQMQDHIWQCLAFYIKKGSLTNGYEVVSLSQPN